MLFMSNAIAFQHDVYFAAKKKNRRARQEEKNTENKKRRNFRLSCERFTSAIYTRRDCSRPYFLRYDIPINSVVLLFWSWCAPINGVV